MSMTDDDTGMQVDIPFDPATKDVICRRELIPSPWWGGHYSRIHVNIPQAVVSHSPSGFEWGYGGSGPSDFALNILHLFLPPHTHGPACYEREEGRSFLVCDGNVKCYRGEVSRDAWDLHQDFKREFIARLPKEGGRISGMVIRIWIAERLAAMRSVPN
jgi:hypothetical protein